MVRGRGRFLALPLVAVAAFVAGAPTFAQAPVSALRNHDTNAPIDIDADRIEVRDQQAQAIFTGEVKVRQGRMALDADQLRVFYRRGEGSADNLTILRIDAEGDVTLASPSERARAGYGIYDVEERQLTMIGNVVLNRGDTVLRGQRLAIDLETGRSTLDGASGGSTAPEASSAVAQGGRVTGRFVVPARRSEADGTAAPEKATPARR